PVSWIRTPAGGDGMPTRRAVVRLHHGLEPGRLRRHRDRLRWSDRTSLVCTGYPRMVVVGLLSGFLVRPDAAAAAAPLVLGPGGRPGLALGRAGGRRGAADSGRAALHLPGGWPRRLYGAGDAGRT